MPFWFLHQEWLNLHANYLELFHQSQLNLFKIMAAVNAAPEENEGNHNNKSMVKISILFLSWQALKGLVRLQALAPGNIMTCHNSTGYGSSCVSSSSCPSMSGKDVRVWRTRGKDAALKQTKKRRLRRLSTSPYIIYRHEMCTFACIQFLFKLTFLFLTKQPTFLTHRLFCQALPHDRAGPNVQENEEQHGAMIELQQL